MTDDPFDEKLFAELNRRAASASLSRDWSQRVLLPSVTSAIDRRPQAVMTSRWSAFAGLTAVVAILLVMVVALPRIVPGPPPISPTSTSVALGTSPTTRPSPVAPPGLRVLSTKEFASALAAGELDGSTLLVDGEIGSVVPGERGPACVPPYEKCLARLVGTDPAVEIEIGWIRAQEGEGGNVQTPGQWGWWSVPAHDVPGTLLVRVAGDGTVEFLGLVGEAGPHLALSVDEIVDLNPNSVPVSRVFVVDGWLHDAEPPGTELIIDCIPQPSGSQIDGLPSRYCQPADSLTNLPVVDRRDAPDGGVSMPVQIGAADRFGRGEISSHALFAISPRLYAGCFPGPSPCWQWDVVGRLSDSPAAPEMSPEPGRAVTCEPVATPPTDVDFGWRPMLTDQSGLVVDCEAWAVNSDDSQPMAVANFNGHLDILEVTWADACASYANFTFDQTLSGFELVAHSAMPINVTCDGVVLSHGLRLYLSQSVAADMVSTRVTHAPAATCSGDVDLIDRAGLIESCTAHDVSGNPDDAGLVASGSTIGVIWERSSCAARTSAELATDGDGYALSIIDGDTSGCEDVQELHVLTLEVRRPITAEQLTATVNGSPLAWRPPRVEPAWWELAPTERPTADSLQLDLLVFERGCASGHSPEDRLEEPTIEYGDTAITITFMVRAPTGAQLCPGAPGAPVTIELSEPLGDRRLVDGGFAAGDRVIQHDDGLLWVVPFRADETALRRFTALLGDNSCPEQGRQEARVSDGQLGQLANDLGTSEGMLGDGLAWLGSVEAAVQELGGFELYQDTDSRWYMIGFAEQQEWLADGVEAGDLVLADISFLTISADRTIWIPGRYHQTFGSADCQWDSDATPAAGPRADEEALDFTVSIWAPSASWTVGQSLEGFGAALEYSGGQDPIDLVGSGSGFTFAYWTRLDGAPSTPSLAMTADCRPYQFAAGERRAIGMWPTGGFAHNGQLTLPPGIWRLTAFTAFTIGECGGQEVALSASIIVRVR